MLSHPSITDTKRGSVLVAVLGITALILLLVLGVLSQSRDSTRRSSIVADGLEAEALARLPAEIIATQIQRATTQNLAADGTALLWASQPGMIRVFGTTVPAGKDRARAEMHYRLYSAPVMNSAALDVVVESRAFSSWAARPAFFTDLNEPITSLRNHETTRFFPIADSAALGQVEGFSVNTPAPGEDAKTHPLPMPAAWIYVLKDGQLVTPDPPGSGVASFPPDVVTKRNPIVGRIAFWTDDESCKLNLNTASEAAPWEMPRANTRTDRAFAAQPPAAAEHHRFSGHPAFTSLSPVVAAFGGYVYGVRKPVPDPGDPLVPADPNKWLQYQNFYQSLVPHGATMPWTAGTAAKQDRHFTSVDEFSLDPLRKNNGAAAGYAITTEDTRRSRFFLTTHSAAPELNPFGGPKIALWTLLKDVGNWSDEERRISLCTAINTDPRINWRREFALTRVFGFSSPASLGSSQSTSDDWTYAERNQQLFAWLQSMSGRKFPGYGGRFVDKYGVMSRDEILVSMFDMMRWSSNSSLPSGPGGSNPAGKGEQSAQPLSVPGTTAAGTSLPARGFGRFPTITEVAVVFAFTDVERNASGQPRDDDGDGICDRATALRAFLVANPFVPAAGPPAVSPAWTLRYQRLMHWSVGPGITLGLPGGSVLDRCTLSSSLPISNGLPWGGHASAYAGFAAQFLQANGDARRIGIRENADTDFPFISLTDVKLPTAEGRPGATLAFSGGRIIVNVMAPDALPQPPKPGDSIQSIELEFPPAALPLPSLRVQDFTSGPRSLADRFKPMLTNGELRLPLIQKGDIVRSMVLNPAGPSKGDARLLALRPELLFNDAANWFTPHPDYTSKTRLEAQTLRDGAYMLSGQYGSTGVEGAVQPTAGGQLIPGVTYAANAVPAVPALQNGALQPPIGTDPGNRLGDWESGGGLLEDGPFVNRRAAPPQGMFSRGRTVSDDVGDTREPLGIASSAVMFGAIPSGVYGGRLNAGDSPIDPTPRPWQTLLFCPNPAGRLSASSLPGRYNSITRDHFGFASPPDHLWLDFFWMPVTSPWAMSKDFATEGKVNMNFQMMPYTWIHRATAMHGALKGVRITAIPTKAMTAQGASAKGHDDGTPLDASFRYDVDAAKTLAAFDARFAAGDIFRTPSDICEMFLVPRRIPWHNYDVGGQSPPDPAGLAASDMTGWWNGSEPVNDDAFEATGDNLREAPYAALHPRLCTQSNVFRVHYRVQYLRKSRTTKPEIWVEDTDHVAGEQRGSYVLERQYAPGTSPVPDPAVSPGVSLNTMQKIKIIEHVKFAP